MKETRQHMGSALMAGLEWEMLGGAKAGARRL